MMTPLVNKHVQAVLLILREAVELLVSFVEVFTLSAFSFKGNEFKLNFMAFGNSGENKKEIKTTDLQVIIYLIRVHVYTGKG